MHISEELDFTPDQIFDLYENACWNSYWKDKDKLWESIQKSLLVVTYRENEEILGYARILGDGVFTILIQDLIVKNTMQRWSIGFNIISHILNKYKEVRQVLLICDKEEKLMRFYKKCGLFEIQELNANWFAILRWRLCNFVLTITSSWQRYVTESAGSLHSPALSAPCTRCSLSVC